MNTEDDTRGKGSRYELVHVAENPLSPESALSDSGFSSVNTELAPATFFEKAVNWLYPPYLPESTQLWRISNIAIPLCYCLVGTVQGLSSGVMAVYPIELGATEAQQTTISVLRALPASFKILFGFLSDTVPLFGFRRKGYMFLGWLLSSLSIFSILLSGTPSIAFLSLCYFLFGFGFWFADVIADSLVAERAKFEPEGSRGGLQSTCYSCRFFMLMVASAFATYAYDALGPSVMFWILAVAPIIMLPACYFLRETRNGVFPSVKEQSREIWDSVSSRSAWQPIAFIYIYNMFQIGNAAWRQFLYTRLNFTATMINSLTMVANVLLYSGIMIYKYGMMSWSWRVVYVFTTVLNSIFSLLQIILIMGWNEKLGISNYLFALGDDAIAEFIGGMQFLPSSIMFVNLCPEGSEGASYAMFTTASNTAGGVAQSISTILLEIWDVSKEAFERGYVVGMANLTVLTTLLQTLPLLLVFMLPKGRDELLALNNGFKNRLAGGMFLGVVAFGIVYSIIVAIVNVLGKDHFFLCLLSKRFCPAAA